MRFIGQRSVGLKRCIGLRVESSGRVLGYRASGVHI